MMPIELHVGDTIKLLYVAGRRTCTEYVHHYRLRATVAREGGIFSSATASLVQHNGLHKKVSDKNSIHHQLGPAQCGVHLCVAT